MNNRQKYIRSPCSSSSSNKHSLSFQDFQVTDLPEISEADSKTNIFLSTSDKFPPQIDLSSVSVSVTELETSTVGGLSAAACCRTSNSRTINRDKDPGPLDLTRLNEAMTLYQQSGLSDISTDPASGLVWRRATEYPSSIKKQPAIDIGVKSHYFQEKYGAMTSISGDLLQILPPDTPLSQYSRNSGCDPGLHIASHDYRGQDFPAAKDDNVQSLLKFGGNSIGKQYPVLSPIDEIECDKPDLALDYGELIELWRHFASSDTDTSFNDCREIFLSESQSQVSDSSYQKIEPSTSREVGYSRTRSEQLRRYREKRLRRTFQPKIRYRLLKANADKRPRFKGRFVKKSEFGQN